MADQSSLIDILVATAFEWGTVALNRMAAGLDSLARPSVLFPLTAVAAVLAFATAIAAYRATRKAAQAQRVDAQALADTLQSVHQALGDLQKAHDDTSRQHESEIARLMEEINTLHTGQVDSTDRLETRIDELRAEQDATAARLDERTDALSDRLVSLRDGLYERHDDLTNQSRLILQAIASLRSEVVEHQTAKYRVNEAIRRVMPSGQGNS